MRLSAPALLLALFAAAPASAQRLPSTVTPDHYDLRFAVDLAHARFEGTETIRVDVAAPTMQIVLNAVDIDVHEATIAAGGTAQTVLSSPDVKAQTITLRARQQIGAGPAEIHLTFTGQLNDKLRGFYLSRGKGRNYAVTQFESTDARRAFPCFDEPAFKATFAISIVAATGDTVISNGAVVSDTPGPGAAQHTVAFATTPKMSTYLVAMAVGDFQCLEGSADGIPVRVCATPDKKALGAIALESAEQILRFYDRYFAITYPFHKLDVLAVPDFAAGAMENTAAIFYRETDLLADTKTASVSTRKNIASVLAHEMAHQWFGDLVTMAWWDDIWLNEGFATWMANHPLAAWKPEWNVPVDEALETQAALNLDSLKNTRAIHAAAETPGEIEELFDVITYQKGAAVLRMIEHYVGPDSFRTGINAYLQAHAYGNATSQDFWTAIARASGKPVDRIMPTFVNQPGAPLLDVSVACRGDRTELTVAQQRFFLDPALLRSGTPERWQIPICDRTGGQQSPSCNVLTDPRHVVATGASGCASWVFANAGAEGYYRTAYAPEALRAMAPHVETDLSAPERLSLVGDEWALVRAGRHGAAEYLALASGFGRESSSGVLSTLTGRLAFVREYLANDAARPTLEAFTRTLLRPLFEQLGFAPSPSDPDDRRSLRAVVIGALGTTGNDPQVAAEARQVVERALTGGPALDPTLATTLVRVAAEHGDAKLYDAFTAAAERAAAPEEHYRYVYALPRFREPALIARALQYAVSPQLRSQDAPIYLSAFFGNPAAREPAWRFITQHWSELEPKVTIAQGDMVLAGSLGAFCEAGTRDDVTAFFAAHPLPAATRTLQQALESITNCVELKERETPNVTKWAAAR